MRSFNWLYTILSNGISCYQSGDYSSSNEAGEYFCGFALLRLVGDAIGIFRPLSVVP